MRRYVEVSKEELSHIAELAITIKDLEIEEEEALDDEIFESLRSLLILDDEETKKENK